MFSRKPDPNFLSVDVKLDEADWAAHIRETLESTCGTFVGVSSFMRVVSGRSANPASLWAPKKGADVIPHPKGDEPRRLTRQRASRYNRAALHLVVRLGAHGTCVHTPMLLNCSASSRG